MGKVYFSESQCFDVLWVKFLVIMAGGAALTPLLVACYRQIFIAEPWGTEPLSDLALILLTLGTMVLLVAVYLLNFNTQLQTRITSEGISYRYWPFVHRWKTITPDLLESAALRKYRAWREFGGRGYKIRRLFGKSRGLTIAGDQGLQLDFKNGHKLLIGTQRPEELRVALRKLLKE